MRGTPLGRILLIGGIVLLVAGGGAAGACKLALDCHLARPAPGGELGAVAKPTEGDAKLPAGLSEETVVEGLTFPTSFAFLPDGRVLVAERDGVLRLSTPGGVTEPTSALDLRGRVATAGYRGLVAVEVDPEFEENGFVYVIYSVAPRSAPVDAKDATVVRVSRFVMHGNVVDPATERVLVGSVDPPTGSCTDLPPTADCLPSDVDHIGGDLVFADDGSLFVTTGDGGGNDREVETTALRAQSADALGGKILRITRDGKGLPSNPFFRGDESANRAKVWAVGLRNPFRMTLTPGAGLPVVGEVGSHAFDEISLAPRGANLGWPCYEGTVRAPTYKGVAECAAMYRMPARSTTAPVLAFAHDGTISVTGGVFNTGDVYPDSYRGVYVYGDWALSTISVVRIDRSGKAVGGSRPFATEAGGPVQFRLGPEGLLYYLSLNNGELRRIVPTGS